MTECTAFCSNSRIRYTSNCLLSASVIIAVYCRTDSEFISYAYEQAYHSVIYSWH